MRKLTNEELKQVTGGAGKVGKHLKPESVITLGVTPGHPLPTVVLKPGIIIL